MSSPEYCISCAKTLPEETDDAVCDTCRKEEAVSPEGLFDNIWEVLRSRGCSAPKTVTTQILEVIADKIEEVDVPIDIEHWMKTKRELSRQTGLALAKWFREEARQEPHI